jgi:hypothetical protein
LWTCWDYRTEIIWESDSLSKSYTLSRQKTQTLTILSNIRVQVLFKVLYLLVSGIKGIHLMVQSLDTRFSLKVLYSVYNNRTYNIRTLSIVSIRFSLKVQYFGKQQTLNHLTNHQQSDSRFSSKSYTLSILCYTNESITEVN